MHYKRQDGRDNHRDHHTSYVIDGMVLDIYLPSMGDIGYIKDNTDAR